MLLTDAGHQHVAEIAQRHGFSPEAAEVMLSALVYGNGTQAQFSHPEFGGMGQWSMGGMLMIGDMFNNGLKSRVDALAQELSGMVGQLAQYQPAPAVMSAMAASGGFAPAFAWPEGLGEPTSSGAQNDMQYAVFPGQRRLAVRQGGQVTVYDTADHVIGGVSQQQGGGYGLQFSSQYGPVSLDSLTRVAQPAEGFAAAPTAIAQPEGSAFAASQSVETTPVEPTPDVAQPIMPQPSMPQTAEAQHSAPQPNAPQTAPTNPAPPSAEIFAAIEQLHGLYTRDILTQAEFDAKKAELLSRL